MARLCSDSALGNRMGQHVGGNSNDLVVLGLTQQLACGGP